jgi:AcrR family transcriptional regulator
MDIENKGELEKPRLTTKGVATRQKIVESAADLICHRGVAGVSIEDIQKAAQVSASQLYHYFESKQELVHAAIDWHTQLILEGQQSALIHLTSFDALRAWGKILVAMQKRGNNPLGAMVTSLAGELAGADPEAHAKISDGFEQWESHVREGLSAMRSQGILKKEADPQKLALAMMSAIQGGLLLAQVRGDTEPLEVAFETMARHIESFSE